MKDTLPGSNLLILFVAINTSIYLVLSILHFYWAFGGTIWFYDVLPTNSRGTERMEPGVIASFVVSVGLLLLAFITIGNLGPWDHILKRKYFRYSGLFISVLFFLRAIGDFKFVGFFKTVTGTRFALNDTQLFSPLCAFIGLTSILIFYLNKNES